MTKRPAQGVRGFVSYRPDIGLTLRVHDEADKSKFRDYAVALEGGLFVEVAGPGYIALVDDGGAYGRLTWDTEAVRAIVRDKGDPPGE